MANIIKLRQSSTTTAVPTAGQLEVGELAYNSADHKLWIKDNAGTVRELPTTAVDVLDDLSNVTETGRVNGSILYYDQFGGVTWEGSTAMTYNGTTLDVGAPRGSPALTITNTTETTTYITYEWDNAGVGVYRVAPTIAGVDQTTDFIYYTSANGWRFTTMPVVTGSNLDIVPSGGTAGQVLTKDNASDYVYSWADPAGSDTLGGLTDVDLTGAADNDLLFRSGGNWIDTAGDLTWDGTTLALGQEKGIQLSSAPNGTADIYMSGSTLYIDGSAPAGVLSQIRTDADIFLTDPAKRAGFNINYGSFVNGVSARLLLYGDNAVTSNHRSEIGAWNTGELYFRQSTSSSQAFLFGGSAMNSGSAPYYVSFDDTVADFDVTIVTEASTASTAFFRLPHGTAPTTPVDGDMWTTTAGVFARVNGVTEDLTAGAATLGDLTDVDLTGAAAGDFIYYDGADWVINPALAYDEPSLNPRFKFDSSSGFTNGLIFEFQKSDTQTMSWAWQTTTGSFASNHVLRYTATEEVTWEAGTTGGANSIVYTIGTDAIMEFSTPPTLPAATSTRGAIRFTPALTDPGASALSGDMYIRQGSARGIYINIQGTKYSVPLLENTEPKTWSAKQTWVTPTTSTASINLPHGTAPTTPTNGDVWTTTAGMYVRVNGSTVGPLGAGGATVLDDLTDVDLTGAADNDLLVRSGGNWVDTAGNLTWDGSTFEVAGEIRNTVAAPAFTGRADATAGARRLLEFENWDGVSAYEDVWRMIFGTGTGNAARVQIQTDGGAGFESLITFDADGVGGQRLIFEDGFKVENDQALFTGGSASAPGIAFSGETNTGFYRSAASNIDISVAGTQVANINTTNFTIFDNLRVAGIIRKDSDTSNLSIFGGDGTGANIELYGGSHATNPNKAYYDAVSHTFRDQDASPTILVIEPNLLTVSGSIDSTIANDTIVMNRDYGSAPNTLGSFQIRGDNTTQGAGTNQRFGMGLDADGTAWLNNTFSTGGSRVLQLKTANTVRLELSDQVSRFNTNTATTPVSITRLGNDDESLQFLVNDSIAFIDHVQDEVDATVHETRLRTLTGASGAHRVTIFENTSESHRFYTGGEGYYMFGGALRVYDSGTSDFAAFSHDGTDFNTALTNTTDWNITGITALKVGANIFPGSQTIGYIGAVTGSFGSIEVTGADGSSGTWSGYSIGGEVVFMSNLTGVGTTNRAGLYDDINNAWVLQFNESAANREVVLYYAGSANINTQGHNSTGNTSGGQVRDHVGDLQDIGFNVLVDQTTNASDTLEAKHCGAMIASDNSTTYTVTLEASSSTDFPAHGVTTILNAGTGNINVNEGTGTTLYYVEPGTGRVDTTGGAVVGPGGLATLWRATAAVYYIWGSEITYTP